MKVSLNQVKQYIDFDLPPVDELVARINAQLGAIEEIIDLGAKYKDAVIVKVVHCEKHPDADRLNVCMVDDGGVVSHVPRDENGLVQVVCGAPNVHADMFAVWLPPKSTVPASYDDKEPFVLSARELRGVLSQGMLAAPDELAIGTGHEGLLVIDPDEWKPNNVPVKPGASFAKAYGLDDTIIDIENKMFTHRPDLFGQLGVAREIAGIQHQQFTSPDWYLKTPEFKNISGLQLEVFNDAGDNVPRFMAVALKGIEVKPSPLWLQCALVAMGGKPINNIVDVTNYVMLLTAQPTHAYDYDKIRGHKLGARMATMGEKVELLNGKTYELTESDIVIADAEGPVGLGGIMGGGNSEVSADTTNIVLEVANFDMYTLRKSSMRHGVFTDALTRFNKGQSPLQNAVVLDLLMKSVFDVAGGEQASEVFDEKLFTDQYDDGFFDSKYNPSNIDIDEHFINERLGLDLTADDVCELLGNTEIDAHTMQEVSRICLTVPFWRTDLELAEDIVEEVGRLYNFEKLPRQLPRRSTKPTPKNVSRELAWHVRAQLSRAGANEVLTYSFVHEKVLHSAGQDKTYAYQIANALSPDLQYYRLSLTPSLLDKVHANQRAGYEQFALFELNKVHYKGEMDEHEPAVPNEDRHVALTLAYGDKHAPDGSPYYAAKRYLEQAASLTDHEYVPLAAFDMATDAWGAQLTAPFEPNRSAVIVRDGRVWGVVGEYRTGVKRAFKLPEFSAGFEVHEAVLTQPGVSYQPLSKYPSTSRDICFKVGQDVSYRQVVDAASSVTSDDVRLVIAPLDLYQGSDTTTKNITLSVTLTPYEKTLSNDEAAAIVQRLTTSVVNALGAQVV